MTVEAPAAAPSSTAAPAPNAADPKNGKLPGTPPTPAKMGTDGKPVPPAGMTDAEKKIWKMKIFDKEVDFDATDLTKDEEKLKKLVQKGLAADVRFQQASEVEKQLAGIIRALREKPEGVLLNEKLGHKPEVLFERLVKALGPNARPIIEKIMGGYVDQELMDPKDRELAETKQKMAEYEEEKRKAQQAEQDKQMADLKSHYQEQYSKDIMTTLEKSGLPKTPSTVKRMAYYMHQGLQRGVQFQAADVVDFVKQDYIAETTELYGALDGDVLLSILGPALTDKLVKAATASKQPKLPLKPLGPGEQPKGDDGDQPQGKKRFITSDEFRAKHGI